MKALIHRDTKAWQLQVWISFAVAVFLCGVGLAYLPGKDLDRAFMVMGYFFCLTTAFVLAKFVRDAEQSRREGKPADTPMFRHVVWSSFFLAMTLTGWDLLRMEINETYKAFLGVSWLYLITCAFPLQWGRVQQGASSTSVTGTSTTKPSPARTSLKTTRRNTTTTSTRCRPIPWSPCCRKRSRTRARPMRSGWPLRWKA